MPDDAKKPKPKKLPHLNVRLAWLSQKLAEDVPDRVAIEQMAEHFKIKPLMAKRYLDALYAHWEQLAAPEKSRGRVRVEAILFRAVQGSEKAFQYNAMVNAADKLAKLYGLYEPSKVQVDVSGAVAVDGPDPKKLEQRMRDMLRDPKVRERAQKLGLDIDVLETKQEIESE